MVKELYCLGCGVEIQTEHQNKPGYTPRSALQNNEDLLCRRCFRLKHYNETEDVGLTDDDFHQMISSIRNKRGIVVHIIDLFDVDGSMLANISRLIGDKPTILVGNKVDLLPKSTNRRKLEQWLRSSANNAGINTEDVCLISATKGHGLDELKTAIEQYRNQENVYVIGTTNVGKSTFINQLIQESTGMKHVITTSYFPGTTLGFIEIPLDEQSYLVDTPGIVNKEQIVHYLSDDDLKIVMPHKEMKPKVYQLTKGQSLFFGGLIRLDIIRGEKQSAVCYVANELLIHRTKMENAPSLYDRQLGKLLSPPNEKTLEHLPAMTQKTFKITDNNTDVVFPGLGWVTFADGDVTIAVHYPEDVAVSLRESFTQKGR